MSVSIASDCASTFDMIVTDDAPARNLVARIRQPIRAAGYDVSVNYALRMVDNFAPRDIDRFFGAIDDYTRRLQRDDELSRREDVLVTANKRRRRSSMEIAPLFSSRPPHCVTSVAVFFSTASASEWSGQLVTYRLTEENVYISDSNAAMERVSVAVWFDWWNAYWRLSISGALQVIYVLQDIACPAALFSAICCASSQVIGRFFDQMCIASIIKRCDPSFIVDEPTWFMLVPLTSKHINLQLTMSHTYFAHLFSETHIAQPLLIVDDIHCSRQTTVVTSARSRTCVVHPKLTENVLISDTQPSPMLLHTAAPQLIPSTAEAAAALIADEERRSFLGLVTHSLLEQIRMECAFTDSDDDKFAHRDFLYALYPHFERTLVEEHMLLQMTKALSGQCNDHSTDESRYTRHVCHSCQREIFNVYSMTPDTASTTTVVSAINGHGDNQASVLDWDQLFILMEHLLQSTSSPTVSAMNEQSMHRRCVRCTYEWMMCADTASVRHMSTHTRLFSDYHITALRAELISRRLNPSWLTTQRIQPQPFTDLHITTRWMSSAMQDNDQQPLCALLERLDHLVSEGSVCSDAVTQSLSAIYKEKLRLDLVLIDGQTHNDVNASPLRAHYFPSLHEKHVNGHLTAL